jgi:phosphoserine phosphatase
VPTSTLLLTISGPDRPGITAALMARLSELGTRIDDIEQVVVRRQLVLGVLVTTEDEERVADAARVLATANGLTARVDSVDTTPTERGLGVVVTVLAQQLSPSQIGAAATAVARVGGNIDRIVRMARYPVTAYELAVSGAEIEALRN